MHARHLWLVNERSDLAARLGGDPEYYDAQAAGWWLWGASCWIGGLWCHRTGSWHRDETGRLVKGAGGGVRRQIVHLSTTGNGVHQLAPYDGIGHDAPPGWWTIKWKANGGHENRGKNRGVNAARETLWCSPACLPPRQLGLFDDEDA